MDRRKLVQNFSNRLIYLMRQEGHETSRAGAGVDISKLARITGCSYQMARKYILGQALPDIDTIINIAAWLNTAPGWLLFGENNLSRHHDGKDLTIEINLELLKYILNKSTFLFSLTENKDNIVNFLIDTIYDAAHINADSKTIYKVIDMMLTSATLLNNPDKDSKTICTKTSQ